MTPVPKIEHYEINESSEYIQRLIPKKARSSPNPIGERNLRLPFNTMAVGESIWINMDDEHPFNVQSVRIAAMNYNKKYPYMFEWVKHRGDKRKSGFKWLEIGRIR